MTLLTSHFVANGDLQTAYYEVARQTQAPAALLDVPFILVHGFTGSKLDFSNQLPWFAQDHRVIAYDQRGHGESSNAGPYDLYTLAGDLVNFLDALSIDQCHILGHSLGGMVVIRALLSHPQRFKSAILMDTAPYALNLFPPEIRAQLNKIITEKGCVGLLDGMRDQPQNPAVQRGISFLGEAEHWRRIQVKLEQMDPQAFFDLAEVLADQPSVLESLSNIEQLTTVIVGENDKPFRQPAKHMAKALLHSNQVVIADAGHSPQYENHEAWRATVERHLMAAS